MLLPKSTLKETRVPPLPEGDSTVEKRGSRRRVQDEHQWPAARAREEDGGRGNVTMRGRGRGREA